MDGQFCTKPNHCLTPTIHVLEYLGVEAHQLFLHHFSVLRAKLSGYTCEVNRSVFLSQFPGPLIDLRTDFLQILLKKNGTRSQLMFII